MAVSLNTNQVFKALEKFLKWILNIANYDWLICDSPWPGDCDGAKLMKLQFVNHLCWTLLEVERAVWFTVRVQLHLVSTVHRLKIDACPNPHLHPHALTFSSFVTATQSRIKECIEQTWSASTPHCTWKTDWAFRGKPWTLRSSLSHCTLTQDNNGSPISSYNTSSEEGTENHSTCH